MLKIMEWILLTTHLAPMLIQASLLSLTWTHPDQLQHPTIRWTRLSLVPISFSFLLADLWNLKNSQLPTLIKLNLGCTFGTHIFRLALLASQQPPSETQSQGRTADANSSSRGSGDDEQSGLQKLFSIFFLAFAGSTNPSHRAKELPGGNKGVREDTIFFLRTLRRMIFLNFWSVAALMSWKLSNDETIISHQPIFMLIRNYKSEIRAFSWGMFVWIGIDLQGCIYRLLMFTLKVISRSSSRVISNPKISKKLETFNQLQQVDLSQAFPFFFKKLPLAASSLTDFWSRHWHEMLKDLFLEAGVTPVTHFLVSFLGFQPKSKFVRISGIMGAFAVSAVLHEVGLWAAAPLDPTLKTSVFFLSQGVGVCLENGFKKIFGRKVNGILGRIWLLTWLVYFGTPMVSIWLQSLGFDQKNLFKRVDDIGFFQLMFSPFIVPRLLLY